MSASVRSHTNRFSRSAILLLASLVSGIVVWGETSRYTFDEEQSTLEISVPPAGLMRALGHHHHIRVGTLSGTVDVDPATPSKPVIGLVIQAASTTVMDTEVSEKTRKTIEETMHGETVLSVSTHPEISFISQNIDVTASGKWGVSGLLTLRGVARPVEFTAEVTYPDKGTLSASGSINLKPEDFGIAPVKALGGTIKTASTIEIQFTVIGSAH